MGADSLLDKRYMYFCFPFFFFFFLISISKPCLNAKVANIHSNAFEFSNLQDPIQPFKKMEVES